SSSALRPLHLFSFSGPAPTLISTLSLHDALPILPPRARDSIAGGEAASGERLLERSGRSPRPSGDHQLRARSDRSEVRALTAPRSEEHTSELQSRRDLVCRLLLEKKNKNGIHEST